MGHKSFHNCFHVWIFHPSSRVSVNVVYELLFGIDTCYTG